MRIAVIGGGVAGITAAHLIQRRHDVALFEKNDYVGGHTNTVVLAEGPDAGTPVDTGFIVLNDRTYPLLNRFFDSLGVAIRKSDMSFSYCCQESGFQYASRTLDTVFACRRSLIEPSFWRMLAEIVLFNRSVLRGLKSGRLAHLTLGQFLLRHRFSRRFKEQYLFPMVAAIWSAPDVAVDRFPMLTFARFFHNHGLLRIQRHLQWYSVAGGSQTYVGVFLERFRGSVYPNARIASIQRSPTGIRLKDDQGHEQTFDAVVIATHADEALRLLADPSDREQGLLGVWRYSKNQTFLHTDPAWMPPNRRAWASWNVIRARRSQADSPVTLTYHMNRLQGLKTHDPYFVTLNPFRPIPEERIIAQMTYTHPVFTFESLATQADLSTLNGENNTYFCGSYFGYGFHEDAVRAGVQAAAAMGVAHAF